MLRKINEKAQTAYFQGLQPLRRDIFSSSTGADGGADQDDELAIFSGRKPRTVVTKSNRPPRISPSMSASSSGAVSSAGASAGGLVDDQTYDLRTPVSDEDFAAHFGSGAGAGAEARSARAHGSDGASGVRIERSCA